MPIYASDIPTPAVPVCLTSRISWSRRKRPVWALQEPDLNGVHLRLGFGQLAGEVRIEAFEAHLTRLLNSGTCVFLGAGTPRVVGGPAPARPLQGLRLVIDSDEQGASRFHVLGAGVDTSFALADGTLVAGGSDHRRADLIRYWFLHAKPHLLKAWMGPTKTTA